MDMPEILNRVNETIETHVNKTAQNVINNQQNQKRSKTPNKKKTLKVNEDPEQLYDIERILKCRKRGNKKEYLIKWQGYPSSENSWEPSRYIPEYLRQQFHIVKTNPQRVMKRQN